MATYPADPWTWTDDLTPSPDYEYLYHNDGTWYPWTGTGIMNHFFLGDLHYAAEMTVTINDYYGGIIFELKDGYEADADLYPSLIFRIALDTSYQLTVDLLILEDATGKQAERGFVVGGYYPNFYEIVLAVGAKNAAYWDYVEPGFDWKKIKRIMLRAWFKETVDTGAIFIANLHFESIETKYSLKLTVFDEKTEMPIPAIMVTPGFIRYLPEEDKEVWYPIDAWRQETNEIGEVYWSALPPDIYVLKVNDERFLVKTHKTIMKEINLTQGSVDTSVLLPPTSPTEEVMKIVFPLAVMVGATTIIVTLIQQI